MRQYEGQIKKLQNQVSKLYEERERVTQIKHNKAQGKAGTQAVDRKLLLDLCRKIK